MNFWKEHFDHILLALLGIAGGVAGAWCSAHHLEDSSKWFYGQAAATLAALLMRMNGPRQVPNAPGPDGPKV
jgi:hypothetical protein